MQPTLDDGLLDKARRGDQEAFRQLLEPHVGEIRLHCYRMTGGLHDAEDLTQETLLKAWRGLAGFDGRANLRTWLYRVATNACLDEWGRRRRHFPPAVGGPSDPHAPVSQTFAAEDWLEPYPDALLEQLPAQASVEPEARFTLRESLRFAFLAAVQMLPARQRAVLLLRDVLAFTAAETAEIMGMTSTAANSALQRARTTLAIQRPDPEQTVEATADQADLVRRYMLAFERGDIHALVRLISEDAIMTMPPDPAWFRGRPHILIFLGTGVFAQRGPLRTVATAANRSPAVALYQRGPDGSFEALSLQVLVVKGGKIAEIIGFVDPALFADFGLPVVLKESGASP